MKILSNVHTKYLIEIKKKFTNLLVNEVNWGKTVTKVIVCFRRECDKKTRSEKSGT